MPTRSTHTTSLLLALAVMTASAASLEAQSTHTSARLDIVGHVGQHTTIRRATYPDFTQPRERTRTTVSARGNVGIDLFVRLDAPGKGVIEVMDASGSFRPLRVNELVLVSTRLAGAHEVSVSWRTEGGIADGAQISYVIAPARGASSMMIASR